MADLQSLIQAFQSLSGNPATSSAPAMPAGGPDPKAQLMQLLTGAGTPAPAGGNMLQAITQAMGSDPRSRSSRMIPDDNNEAIRQNANSGASVYNAGAEPMGGSGPSTDNDLTQMLDASDSVRRDLPPAKRDGYTGGDEDSGKRPLSTEEELADVQKRMGGDPSNDGNFPTRAEIKSLNSGDITPQQFDKKWGDGAAAEMMDEAKPANDDDGDHEYR